MTDRPVPEGLAASLVGSDASLVDVIDSLVDKGVVLQGDVALGIAGIDLITLKLAALLVSAERLDSSSRTPGEGGAGTDHPHRGTAPRVAADASTAERPVSPDPGPLAGTAPSGASPVALTGASPAATDVVASASRVPPEGRHVAAGRWDVDPDDVRRSVMKLVLTLVEVIRQLLERRAIRQMETDRLSEEEVERLGRSLHELEQTVLELAGQAGLDPADLNLDLGPLGRLL